MDRFRLHATKRRQRRDYRHCQSTVHLDRADAVGCRSVVDATREGELLRRYNMS